MLKVTQYLRTPSEIYDDGVKMALVYKGKTIHPLVTCKDFISDVFWLNYQRKITEKTGISIYDFHHRRKIELLSQDTHELYVTNYPENVGTNLQNFLNEVEVTLRIPYSTVSVANGGYVVSFDKAWREYPYLLSLFLLFVRIGGKYQNEEFFDYIDSYISGKVCINTLNLNDASYLKQALPLIKELMLNQFHFVDDWFSYNDVYSHHNFKGVVCFTEHLKKSKQIQ